MDLGEAMVVVLMPVAVLSWSKPSMYSAWDASVEACIRAPTEEQTLDTI